MFKIRVENDFEVKLQVSFEGQTVDLSQRKLYVFFASRRVRIKINEFTIQDNCLVLRVSHKYRAPAGIYHFTVFDVTDGIQKVVDSPEEIELVPHTFNIPEDNRSLSVKTAKMKVIPVVYGTFDYEKLFNKPEIKGVAIQEYVLNLQHQ